MTDEAMSPLRGRMIEDMTIRNFAPKTQHDYVQRVKNFAAFLGRSPDTKADARIHECTPWWHSVSAVHGGHQKANPGHVTDQHLRSHPRRNERNAERLLARCAPSLRGARWLE